MFRRNEEGERHGRPIEAREVRMPEQAGAEVTVEDWHEIPGMVRLSTFYDPDGTPWMLAQVLDQKAARA